MFFLSEGAVFFRSLQKVSGVSIPMLCKESHVSTRTYYKMMRCEPVKPECYRRLFTGLCRAVTDDEFQEHWEALGKSLYEGCEGVSFGAK